MSARELSLFTGAGGGVYASLLLGWKTIGYVEYDDYCQRVIAQRIKDGIFHEAPIFGDIRHFIESGAVDEYRGVTDVVSGGFPCQPFSIAGKRAGADDERNMWPATIECIRRVQPRYAFLENVPGLLTSGYFGTILGDLAESGYDCRWRVLSAAEVGAPHKRDRLWIVAHANSERHAGQAEQQCPRQTVVMGAYVAHAIGKRPAAGAQGGRPVHHENGDGAGEAAGWENEQPGIGGGGEDVAHAAGAGLSQRQRAAGERPHAAIAGGSWWATEPGMGRVAHGVADRVNRLRAIGNGQVSLVAATAWRLLTGGLTA